MPFELITVELGRTDKNLCRCFGAPARVFSLITLITAVELHCVHYLHPLAPRRRDTVHSLLGGAAGFSPTARPTDAACARRAAHFPRWCGDARGRR